MLKLSDILVINKKSGNAYDVKKVNPEKHQSADASTKEKSKQHNLNPNIKKIKGKLSGKEIKTLELEGGGFLFGTQHGDTKMADDIINQVKATIPKEKWKDIVFVGEGGATGDSGELEFNDEMEYSAPKFKEMGASIDTWDGDELDVHNDQSELYKSQEQQTGLSQSKIKAGNWASMIGQGEGTDTMSPNDYLDDEGKEFLQNAAKEAGFSPIENWDTPSEQDKDTLYRLSFPEDNGDKETGVNDVQVAFNKARDLNLIKKQKELAASGKIPVVLAGESHADLVSSMIKNNKLKEQLQPNEKEMIDGIVEMLNQVEDLENRKKMALDRLRDFKQEGIKVNPKEFLQRCGIDTVNEKWSNKYKRSIDCNNPKGFSQRAHCQGRKKHELVEEAMQLFLEKNCPTDPAKWSASKAAAKRKFDVYPSAYANGWAAKNYKSKGGGWKKC